MNTIPPTEDCDRRYREAIAPSSVGRLMREKAEADVRIELATLLAGAIDPQSVCDYLADRDVA